MKFLRIPTIRFAMGFVALVFLLISITNCADSDLDFGPEPKTWQSTCAPNTILAIITVGRDHPTRGRTCKIGDEYHIQAEYLPEEDGDWIPFRVICPKCGGIGWPQVKEGKIEFGNEPMEDLEYLPGPEVLLEYWSRLKEVPEGRLQH
jgi:hypothetical protein